MEKSLFDQLINPSNIYKAIYSLESYVFEKELLDDDDIRLFNELSDKFDTCKIREVIELCQDRLKQVINNKDEYFKIKVFFKPKKIDLLTEEEDYRPMHTTDLLTQICLVSLLNPIMFDDSNETRKLSDICKLIPSNFYGNIPSTNVDHIFEPWQKQYSDYSKHIIEANKEYCANEKYTHEINLDLEKFFPSVNPLYIYNFIWNKIASNYNSEDKKILDKILKKLLFFKIDFENHKKDIDFYYKNNIKDPQHLLEIKNQKLFFNVGIPQGLPQSYLFGNFCMIEIAQKMDNIFDGDAYFYVDDSVIFTKHITKKNFERAFLNLNSEFLKLFSIENTVIIPLELRKFNRHLSYQVKLNNSKSQISKIVPSDYLFNLAKPASSISFEIKASFDDIEDETLRKKTNSLLKYVDDKIKELGEKDPDLQKLLYRYRKFYAYRLRILDYRKENEVSGKKINKFLKKYGIDPIEKTEFFKKLDDDIFKYEAQMLIKFLIVDKEKQNGILNQVRIFENGLNEEFANNYFSRVLQQYVKFLKLENQRYKSLERYSKESIQPFISVNAGERIKKIKEFIRSSRKFDDKIYQYGFYEFIYSNSTEFKRKLYNALFSYIFSIPINDSCNLIKIDNRAIHYYELRLLMYLRINYKFNLSNFLVFAKNIIEEIENNEEKIDFTLFEVLPYFKKYINDPQQIDDLILTHKFVNGIWKNGSKFLHFYTLHNEEHSVELIKHCTKITKSIDYLSVKKFDYYILFLACYLHDVSMVLYPNIDNFTKDDDLESDLIRSQWKIDFKEKIKDVNKAQSSDIKKFILASFNSVNRYFEEIVRNRHPKNSSKFIKNQSELRFIEKVTRKLVADISEAHGFNTKDVYGLKSKAKDDTISEKYLMIILRLADLLDMSKDRVSINILKQNIKYMPEESKYHWISHMAIDKCTIETEFDATNKANQKIQENVIVRIYLNTQQLTSIKKDTPCENINCKIIGKDSIEVSINKEAEDRCNGNCNFTSKWMIDKHQYLFNELCSLEEYLNRISQTIFDTSFKVIFEIDNTNRLSSEFMDVVSKHLN